MYWGHLMTSFGITSVLKKRAFSIIVRFHAIFSCTVENASTYFAFAFFLRFFLILLSTRSEFRDLHLKLRMTNVIRTLSNLYPERVSWDEGLTSVNLITLAACNPVHCWLSDVNHLHLWSGGLHADINCCWSYLTFLFGLFCFTFNIFAELHKAEGYSITWALCLCFRAGPVNSLSAIALTGQQWIWPNVFSLFW